jgi:hypothetical protein
LCVSQVITVCQDIADFMNNGGRIDGRIINFSNAFALVAHDGLLMKFANSDVDSRVLAWVREFLLCHMQRVSVGGQLSGEIMVKSVVPQGSVRSVSVSSLL